MVTLCVGGVQEKNIWKKISLPRPKNGDKDKFTSSQTLAEKSMKNPLQFELSPPDGFASGSLGLLVRESGKENNSAPAKTNSA